MLFNSEASGHPDTLDLSIYPRHTRSLTSSPHQGKFTPTRASHPCPICEDIKGKCRIVSDDFALCMTYPTNARITGWRYLGETKGSYYAGKYLAIQDESEFDQQQRRENARQLKDAREKALKRQLAQLPDAEERDRRWHQYLNSLSLNDIDRTDLYKRGFTDDQIAAIGFKSVKGGYITPIRNPQGQILGAQLRKRTAIAGGRYIWHKPYGWDIHLPNGDVPLAFYEPFGKRRTPPPETVVLAEGTGVKPALAANLLDCPVIGAAGGNFTASKQELKAYLQSIGAVPDLTKIAIAPDAGDISNPAIIQRLKKTIALVESLGYAVKILWWGQFTKNDSDIDELEYAEAIACLSPAEFLKLAQQQQPWFNKIQTLLGKLSPQPKIAQGFTKQQPQQVEQPKPDRITTYQPGARISTWQAARQQGYKYILDIGATGTGKSFDAGRVIPETFEVRQVIYNSNQHRNVTTNTLKSWADLEARHGGLALDKTGKTRRAKAGQQLTVEANCGRASVVAALRAKGVSGADTDLICQTCPVLNACRHAKGNGYGFKYERREALAKSRLRAHPVSLPDPSEYDYSNVGNIFEEWDENFTTSSQLTVSVSDVDAAIVRLSLKAPELLTLLQPLLVELRNLLTGKQPKFGYDLQTLRAALPQVSINFDELKAVLTPDLSCLDTVDEIAESEFAAVSGKQKHKLAELSRELKKATTLHSQEAEHCIQEEVLKQWLPEFLKTLVRDDSGYAAIQGRCLKLTLPDSRLRTIAAASKFNIFISATGSVEELALKLGCHVDEIFVCNQADSPQAIKPEIWQIKDLGRMGMQRGADQQVRANTIANHYKSSDPTTQVLDYNQFQRDWGWWRDSRGLNDMADTQTLVVVGTPCRNLLDLLAEYATLIGKVCDVDDPGFKAYVDSKIKADIYQCFGRKMGGRCQPGDKIIFISDFELDIPVQQVKAKDITPEAASKSERVEMGIRQAIAWLTEQGKKVTQKAIAEFLGMTREAISHYRDLIFLLLQTLYSKKIINAEPREPDREICQDLAAVVAQVVSSDSPMAEILKGIHEIFFDWIPPRLRRGIMYYLSGRSQSQLLSYLSVVALPQAAMEIH